MNKPNSGSRLRRLFARSSKEIAKRKRQQAARESVYETLEKRQLLASLFVNDNWNLVQDNGVVGTFDAGDIISNANDSATPTQYTLGTDKVFGVVTTGTVTGNLPAITGLSGANLQSAVTAAVSGDTINVLPGTYAGLVTINKNLTIQGPFAGVQGTDASRSAAAGTGEATIEGRFVISSTASGTVAVDGLRFLASSSSGVSGASNPALNRQAATGAHSYINNIFYSTLAGGNTANRAIGFNVLSTGTTLVEGNYVTGNQTGKYGTASWGSGIWSNGGGTSGITIQNNTFEYSRTGMNLDIYGTATIAVTGNTLRSGGTGISVNADTAAAQLNAASQLANITNLVSQDVDTDFNFRNLTVPLTFNVGARLAASMSTSEKVQTWGGTQNDSLTGWANADTINGREGTDTVNFSGDYSQYTFGFDSAPPSEPNPPYRIVVTGPTGTDVLYNVEKLQFADKAVIVVGSAVGSTYTTIASGITAASAGDVVLVAPGTFAENLTINKALTVIGAGNGSDAAANTIIAPASGTAVTISSSSVTLQSVRVAGASTASGNNGIYFDTALSNATLSNVVVTNHSYGIEIHNSAVINGLTLTNVSVINNQTGLRSATTGSATNIVVTGSQFDNNDYGWNIAATSGRTNNQNDFSSVTVSNTTFNNNKFKGLYAEKLHNASFSGVTVTGSGYGTTSPNGINVNLKYGTYSNISFTGLTVTNSGTGTVNGAGVAIAARNDAPSYSSNPASLSGLSFTNATITGSPYDLSIANNISGLTLSGVSLGGTGVGLLSYGSAQGNPASFSVGDTAFAGTLSAYIANAGATTILTATSATFDGVNAGASLTTADAFAIADKVFDSVDTLPYGKVILKSGNVFVTPNSYVAPATAASVQNAVSSASADGTVWVKTGAYTAGYATTTVNGLTLDVASGVTGFNGLILGTGVTSATLSGTGAANLTGNDLDNTLTGNAGDNVVDGLLGIDTAVFSGDYADFTITFDGSNVVVTQVSGGSSVDTVTNVEKLQFNDSRVILVGSSIGSTYATVSAGYAAAGPGDIVLLAPQTYTEPVTIPAGIVLAGEGTLNGDVTVSADSTLAGALVVTGNVIVNDMGTLAGTVTVTGNVTVESGGTISPGNSPGTLTINGNYNQFGNLLTEIVGAATPPGSAGVDYDQVDVTGAVTIDPAATLSVAFSGTPVTSGVSYVIVSNDDTDPVSGEFAALPEGAELVASGGQRFSISYVGGDGNDIALTAMESPTQIVLTGTETSVYGDSVTYTAAVTGDRTVNAGEVEFYIDGTLVGTDDTPLDGFTYTTSALDAGSYEVTAKYLGEAGFFDPSEESDPVALTVSPKLLSIADFAADNKTYDGTVAAVVNGTLNGIVTGDTVSFTGSFDNKNAGTGKTVTASLGGVDMGNYTLSPVTALANITKKDISGSFTADNKTYDGSTTATVATTDVIDEVAGDDVSLSITSATFSDKNAATGKTVTAISYSLSGTDAGNYNLTDVGTTTASIAKKDVSGSFTADNKTYDGTTSATVLTRSLTGTIAGDSVSLNGGTATFNNKNAGSGKTVTLTGSTLSGTDADNYSLTGVGTTTASIAKKDVTGSFIANNKTYDGTTTATVFSTDVIDEVFGDVVSLSITSASFSDKNAATGKTVTANTYGLSGTDAGNYNLTSVATTTADIAKKDVSGSFTADNKTYDGTTSATVSSRSLTGTISGDSVSLSGGTATFDNKNAGTGKTVTLSGAGLSGTDAGNYSLTSVGTTTANIAKKDVSGSFTADNKTYDGTTSATVSARSLTGTISGDSVSLNGGTATFANKNAGTGKTVTLTGAAISGTDAGNYNLTGVGTTTADISKRDLAISSATGVNKIYDQTTTAQISSFTDDRVTGDVLTYSYTANFDNKNVGTSKPVAVTGISIGGTDAGNYNLTTTSTLTTANITKRSVTASIVANNKEFDNTTTATLSSITLNTQSGSVGYIAPDAVTVTNAAANFSNANAGTWTVTATGLSLTGADAGNYQLTSTTATTTATIFVERDAVTRYIGQTVFYTSGTSSTTTKVTLSASVTDPDNSVVGGAYINFYDVASGTKKLLAGNVPVSPVANVPGSGTAATIVTLSSGQFGSQEYVILVELVGNYDNSGQALLEKTATVSVSKPAATSEIIAGGTIPRISTTAGSLAANIVGDISFSVAMKQSKTNPQGKASITFETSTGDIYYVKSNSITSYTASTSTGKATIFTKASIAKLAADGTWVNVDGGVSLRVDLDSVNRKVAFTVLSTKDGTLYFSNDWYYDTATKKWMSRLQSINAGGNVQIR